MGYGDRRLFALMALLFPFVDLRNRFHIDHVFPKSRFTPPQLRTAGVSEDKIETFIDYANRLGNLQLLDGDLNSEKQAKLPAEWLDEHCKDTQARQHYCEQHCLGDVPREIADFAEFYEARRERLQKRIGELVNTVSVSERGLGG